MNVVKASSKYQIVIPKKTRTKLGIHPGQKFHVNDEHGVITFIPLPDDPIEFLYGRYAGEPSMTKALLKERAKDLEHE